MQFVAKARRIACSLRIGTPLPLPFSIVWNETASSLQTHEGDGAPFASESQLEHHKQRATSPDYSWEISGQRG